MDWRRTGAVTAAAVAMAACQHMAPSRDNDLRARREATLAAADWSRMAEVSIEMLDYGYRPRELRLKAGQPYRLTIVNEGSVNHYFTAPEFFASVAARKAQVPRQAEIKAAVFESFEVHPRGGTLEFYFVPMEKGSYRAFCHIKDHLPLAIEAQLVVE